MRGPLVVVMAAALAATGACSDLLGPDRLEPPVLRTLSVAAHSGVLYIRASPVDTSFRLRRGQRLPAEVAVSSGDRETAGLYRRHCPSSNRGSGYSCFQFQLFMESGHPVAEIEDRVAAIGGRFYLRSGGFAGVTMFYPEVAQTAHRAARWPGVAGTHVMGSGGCHPDVSGCFSYSHLLVPMPVDVGDAVPGDGIVQVRPGDVLTVTYQQPGGGTIEATAQLR